MRIRRVIRMPRLAALSASLVVAACAADTLAEAAPGEVARAAVSYEEGAAAAPVHVIYFADYVCDDCAKFSAAAVEPLRAEWVAKNRARLTVVDVAWHRGSIAGSAAAACAAEQGRFWPMHTMLFERQEIWKRAVDVPAKLAEYAAKIGLDTAKYAACASEKRHRERLDAAEEVAKTFAVRGTPAFVVNGKLYYGSQAWPWVEQVLLANERGHPESAPPPPLAVPMKRVVDSARLREIEDSIAGR